MATPPTVVPPHILGNRTSLAAAPRDALGAAGQRILVAHDGLDTIKSSSVCLGNRSIVFLGDSHVRYLWLAVQHRAGCRMHVRDSDRHGHTFICRATPPCLTRLVYIWNVGLTPISTMSASDNCTYARELDCRQSDKALSLALPDYVHRNCLSSASEVLTAELSALGEARADAVVTNVPQWLLSAEGLHDGHPRPTDYPSHAKYHGCISHFASDMLASYSRLRAMAGGRLVVTHHLNLSRWGGEHLEARLYVPLARSGVSVVRMHDLWQQQGANSHITDDQLNWQLWLRVREAIGILPLRESSSSAEDHMHANRGGLRSASSGNATELVDHRIAAAGRQRALPTLDAISMTRAPTLHLGGEVKARLASAASAANGTAPEVQGLTARPSHRRLAATTEYNDVAAASDPRAATGSPIEARLRMYLSAVYHERQAFDAMSAVDLRRLIGTFAWAYLSATDTAVGFARITCASSFKGWVRGQCQPLGTATPSLTAWESAALSAPDSLGARAAMAAADLVLNDSINRKAAATALMHTAALHFEPPTVTSLSFSAYGFWLPRGMPHACMALVEPPFAPDSAWVEVTRLGGDTPAADGRPRQGDGCWFLVAKGSGIFVHVGRSLRANSRRQLAEQLQLNLSKHELNVLSFNPYLVETRFALCAHARAKGYESMQLWDETCPLRHRGMSGAACMHELISCHDACMVARLEADKTQQNTCSPGLPLRTGLHATIPCTCKWSPQYRLLNCEGNANLPGLWSGGSMHRNGSQQQWPQHGMVAGRAGTTRHAIIGAPLCGRPTAPVTAAAGSAAAGSTTPTATAPPIALASSVGRRLAHARAPHAVAKTAPATEHDPSIENDERILQRLRRCSAPPISAAEQRELLSVIAFSLFAPADHGDSWMRRYGEGALANARLLPEVFPGWQMWVYFDTSAPVEIVAPLSRARSVRLINVSASRRLATNPNPRTWRFAVASEPTVGRWLIRDIDSRLIERDRRAVDEWISSGRRFSVMREYAAERFEPSPSFHPSSFFTAAACSSGVRALLWAATQGTRTFRSMQGCGAERGRRCHASTERSRPRRPGWSNAITA